jgi:PhoH-like ATPase
MRKIFVLDTNVLLHDATSIERFADNMVVLPMAVIEELDRFKKGNDELGRNSRAVIRRLDVLRQKGHLGEGVATSNGGLLRIVAHDQDGSDGLDAGVKDNHIIRVAWHYHRRGERVIFVSKDINARIKADALGIEAHDFESQKVNLDELYKGYREITVARELVDRYYAEPSISIPDVGLFPNEFVLLRDETNEKHTGLGRGRDGGSVVHLSSQYERAWNIKPRSKEQRMAFELLLDPAVQIVTLVGQAGTGKTLMALAAGLQSVVHYRTYDKILVTRPIMPLGRDIGYLPGAKDEKLIHWMQPIIDNLTFLLRERNGNEESVYPTVERKVEEMQQKNLLEMEALTYIRGRSIPRQYVIVDEAQNLTPHEVKTIISRAGEGTKMVLTGDPYQIDNPYLDSSSNGLTYTAERLKAELIHGHMTLLRSERSALAAVAASLL